MGNVRMTMRGVGKLCYVLNGVVQVLVVRPDLRNTAHRCGKSIVIPPSLERFFGFTNVFSRFMHHKGVAGRGYRTRFRWVVLSQAIQRAGSLCGQAGSGGGRSYSGEGEHKEAQRQCSFEMHDDNSLEEQLIKEREYRLRTQTHARGG
jgi:hypothetical protein